MANSGLRGPFPLTNNGVDANVSKVSAGAYALGDSKDGTFYIDYVGRSDVDVGGRLHDHIGRASAFKYEYFGSPKVAFEKECYLWHDFNPPGNKVHPDRPSGSGWKCPRCKIFD